MPTLDLQPIIGALKTVLADAKSPVALHEPCFSGNEWAYVKDCLDSGWVSSVGKYVEKFEKLLAEFIGIRRAVAVVNGTAALYLCLNLVGVAQGDEILLPALTFVATANAVTYCGAIPHFADSEERTLGLDPQKLSAYLNRIAEVRKNACINKKTGRRIKAVVPMHTFGHPVDLEPLVELCLQYKLELIEDAAESLGSFYKGKHTGNWGKVSVLSFNGNKTITTGGGGAILTNDEKLGDLAKHLTTTARIPHKWNIQHDQVGFNYRLPNLNASLGCAQLEQLPGFLKKKRDLSERYTKAFELISGVRFFTEPDFAKSNYWLNALLLEDRYSNQLHELLEMTNNLGFMTRPAWTLMHKLPMFQDSPRMDLSMCENLEKRIINLPSSATL
ncbi:MAG: LegC family aminotransferase [Deltaproteobacteria bacterium]|nr:LegC family aminotransferase [Deltaproteobacteria bacterium]